MSQNEFVAAISEYWYKDPLPTSTELDALVFKTYETDVASMQNTLNDADPEIHFFTTLLSKESSTLLSKEILILCTKVFDNHQIRYYQCYI